MLIITICSTIQMRTIKSADEDANDKDDDQCAMTTKNQKACAQNIKLNFVEHLPCMPSKDMSSRDLFLFPGEQLA